MINIKDEILKMIKILENNSNGSTVWIYFGTLIEYDFYCNDYMMNHDKIDEDILFLEQQKQVQTQDEIKLINKIIEYIESMKIMRRLLD